MKKYITCVVVMLLSACAKNTKPHEFACITIYGPATLSTAEEGVSVVGDKIRIEKDDEIYFIGRQACVEKVTK